MDCGNYSPCSDCKIVKTYSAIELDKDRPEAYLALSRWYSWRNQPNKAYSFASMGCQCTKKGFKVSPSLGYDESELQLQRILFSSFDGKYEEKKKVYLYNQTEDPEYEELAVLAAGKYINLLHDKTHTDTNLSWFGSQS